MLNSDRVSAPAGRVFSSIQFGSNARIVIALSGGGDSTALTCLARDHFAAHGETQRLLAVTVDHGLRPESAREALQAGEVCAGLGVEHVVKRWQDDKPAAGLQAAARAARYRLLGQAAADAGAGIVLTGHTLDDQAETVAMRAARGAGRGLSGIAPATLYRRETWFVRPLIGCRRDDLRAWLTGRDQDWIEDPSNRDARFERVRVRQGETGTAVNTARFRESFETRRGEAEAAAVVLSDPAIWRFDPSGRTVELADPSAMGRAGFALSLAIVLNWVGQGAYLPAQGVLEKVTAFVTEGGAGTGMTVAGCLLQKTRGGVRIGREARNRREAGHGFDELIPSPDFAAAAALAARTGEPSFPPPPLAGYPYGYPE